MEFSQVDAQATTVLVPQFDRPYSYMSGIADK